MSEFPDPALLPADILRGLTESRISRRRAMQLGGLSAVSLTLAACGVKGAKKTPNSSAVSSAAKSFWDTQTKTGTLDFANWPLYIDVNDKNSEVIQENASFFGKIQPQLAAGQNIGYDIIVITNGTYLDKLRELGYLTALDQSRMTNFYQNASSLVKS